MFFSEHRKFFAPIGFAILSLVAVPVGAWAQQASEVQVIPGAAGTPLAAGPTASGFNQQLRATNAGAAATVNSLGYTVDGTAKSSQTVADEVNNGSVEHQTLQAAENLHEPVSSNTQTSGLGVSTGEYAELVTKARQADMRVFAAADNYADALLMAIMDYYESMTPAEAVADYVAQGKSYGFFVDSPALADNGKGNFLSLISAAHAASSGKPDVTLLAGNCKWNISTGNVAGQPGQICSGGKQRSQPYPKANGCACAMRAAGIVVHGMQEGGGYPYDYASAESATKWSAWEYHGAKTAQAAHKPLHDMAWRALPEQGGGTSSSNIDPSSFFISKAYAQTGGGASALSQLNSAAKDACTAHQKIKEMAGTHCDDKGIESANSFKHAFGLSCARDPNCLALRAGAGVDSVTGTGTTLDRASIDLGKTHDENTAGDDQD